MLYLRDRGGTGRRAALRSLYSVGCGSSSLLGRTTFLFCYSQKNKCENNMVTIIIRSSEKEKEYVTEQLIKFNHQYLTMSHDDFIIPLNFHIVENNKIIAGINAVMLAKSTVYVSILWVDENHRHNDYGSKLLRHVETEARKLGGAMIHLDTFDFQAKGFYIKQGYAVFGTLENSPLQGCNRYYLQKKL
jgi:N-acetylglutamate synthase-like GNAT family acetyltransferase